MIVKSIYINDKLYTEKDNIPNNEMLNYCASSCHNVVKNNDNYIGDETEVAIYKYLEQTNHLNTFTRIKEYPFDSDRKMMSTINEINNQKYSFTKGSLDSVINKCTHYLKDNELYMMSPEYREEIFKIEKLWDYETEEEIDSISPGVKGQKVFMKLPIKCEEGWILRRKKRD